MNDHEKLTSLFRELGIPFSERMDGNIMVHIEVDNTQPDPVIVGYKHFCTDFEFTTAGKFVNVGIWEL